MRNDTIRIGVVGAGNKTRETHIPQLKAIEGVEVVSLANRTKESGLLVAEKLGIPTVYDNWLEVVEDDDNDAICIGTWPYMHCAVTLAALENNKHVLCEARMAMNGVEARTMLEAARQRPHLITQVVPSVHFAKSYTIIKELISDGYLGEILTVELTRMQPDFVDRDSLLHWRQDSNLSGFNTMYMGMWYEEMMRLVGPATRVMALTKVNVPQRMDANGVLQTVTVPDHVDILANLACGATAHLRFSAVTGLAPSGEFWIFGSEGTLKLDEADLKLYGGRRGDGSLKEINIPLEKQVKWRVEEEFINAIRGKEKISYTTFEEGVRYMEFTEAVIRSAQTGTAINLPL